VKSPCTFDAARRDLERNDFNLQGIDRPCGENAARPNSSTEKEKVASRGQRVLNGLSGAGAWNTVKEQE
jgi:hypothetical protein